MASDDALHGGEADAGAFELAGRVEPLKDTEQLRGVSHVETGSVVSNEENLLAVLPRGAQLDARLLSLARELPRVAEQVFEHHAEKPAVAVAREFLSDRNLDFPTGLRAL